MAVLDRVNPFPFCPGGDVLSYPIAMEKWDGGKLPAELSSNYVFWRCTDGVKKRIAFFNLVLSRLTHLDEMPDWYNENSERFVLDKLKKDNYFKQFTIQDNWIKEGKFNFDGLHGESSENYKGWMEEHNNCPVCRAKSDKPLRFSYLNQKLKERKFSEVKRKSKDRRKWELLLRKKTIVQATKKGKEKTPSGVQLLHYAFPVLVVSKLVFATLRKIPHIPFERFRGKVEGMIQLRKAFTLVASTLLFLNFIGVNISLKKG